MDISLFLLLFWKIMIHKKVLLRERKRYTARRVASARYAALSNGGGGGEGLPHPLLDRGYPIQSWLGGGEYPIQSWLEGVTPLSRPGMGYPPIQTWDGVPLCPDLGWGTLPGQLDGIPPIQTWDGVPPPSQEGWGNPHQLDGVPPNTPPPP